MSSHHPGDEGAIGRTSRANPRVLIAKPGLDGHDRGAKVLSRALRDAGFEVIYSGLRRSTIEIVRAAVDEDVDVVGLSIMSGGVTSYAQDLLSELNREGSDALVLVGGTITEEEKKNLRAMGIEGVFPVGSTAQDVVDYLHATLQRQGS